MFNIKKPPTRSAKPNVGISKTSSSDSGEGFTFSPPKAESNETSPAYSPLAGVAVPSRGTTLSADTAGTPAPTADSGRVSTISQQEQQRLAASEKKLIAELTELKNRLSAVEAENDVLKVC
jgi:hypothetical protein